MSAVLIVDDDPDIRDTIASVLEDLGLEVRTAAHGYDALESIREHGAPDLILLDLLMPVMDGVEFITHLRADAQLARVPVVVISASSTVLPPADIPRLRKPLSLEQLLCAVQAHV